MTACDHRVHGLAGDRVAPDWPPLRDHEVQRVLHRFPWLCGPAHITWRSPRPLSAAARVATVGGEVFVKRHHVSVRRPETLAVEHAFITHLRARGIPIPEVLADSEGRTAIAEGCWTYEVHACAAGLDVYRDLASWEPLTDVAQARTAGRMLARLHRASAGFAAARDTFVLVSRADLLRAADPAATLRAQLPQRPALAEFLRLRDWRRDLAPVLTRQRAIRARLATLPTLWTHNDWHVSNLCWSSTGGDASITSVIDFGLAAPTFALYDLATAIERNAIAWLHLERGMRAIFPDTARALIEGYDEVRPLGAAQRALLADLLPVVHVGFALSEVGYFFRITHSAERTDTAWHTFLLGHAAWFDTAPGRALLAVIRNGA